MGVLTAATIGAISVLGLAQLSTTIARSAYKARKTFLLMILSNEIKQSFQQGPDPSCTGDCFNACTSSLIGFDTTPLGTSASAAIKKPSATPSNAGATAYEGGDDSHYDILIQEIKFTPLSSTSGEMVVLFSLSDDTRETLSAPPSLNFTLSINEVAGKVDKCIVTGASIAGVGLPGIPSGCRQVKNEKTLVGCGGTRENSNMKATAFGYKSGRKNTGDGNSFFGYEAGEDSEIGASNTFVGYQAGLKNEHGNGNTFVGYQTGEKTTTGGKYFRGISGRK